MSSFSGLNSALSALRAQRAGLELAGHNIANANTQGYSRQRVEQTSLGTGAAPARYATASTDSAGVTVTGVVRLRDTYLEARGRTEHERQAALTEQQLVIADIERVFTEPSDTGLQDKLDDLSDGFADVADNPANPAARTHLLARAADLARALNSGATELAEQWSARRTELGGTVDEINTSAARLAFLNGAIAQAKVTGATANELEDQRDVLALRLSELTGATITRSANDSLDVTIGGSSLVSGITARSLAPTGSTTLAGEAGDPVGLKWTDTNAAAGPAGGRAGAQLTALGTTLPDYATALDGVAARLTSTVNAIHTTGFTAAGAAGGAFFSGTTAGTITVTITDPAAVAASSSATLALDGGTADKLAQLAGTAGSADETYRNVVARLGVLAQSADQLAITQNSITAGVDTARLAVAGVSVDEELTAMLSYQRAYEAAARVMTAVDSMLDTLINRTGS
jgi:flagellar hook-associated protein 1 FlgK